MQDRQRQSAGREFAHKNVYPQNGKKKQEDWQTGGKGTFYRIFTLASQFSCAKKMNC